MIIGFCNKQFNKIKHIYTDGRISAEVKNINPYLVDAPDILVSSQGKAISDVPRITAGNKPADGGNLILSQGERDSILSKDKKLECCIKRYVGSRDFINNDEIRYCLWLRGIDPSIYRKSDDIMKRLEAVKIMRMNSSAAPTRAYADRPFLFFSAPQGNGDYLCIPEVSSSRRRYIPIGFMDGNTIASNKLLIIPDATLYHFGVLTSNVHMAWTRVVCGRLKSDYQYSGANVYNTFPWCEPTEEQRKLIEVTAQMILDARAKYPNSSLADLYDDLTMPPELRKAHNENDKAVLKAYGFKPGTPEFSSESACVAALMRMYQEKVSQK